MNDQLKRKGITSFIPYLKYFWHENAEGKYFEFLDWEDVCRLYEFNANLQALISAAIAKIEVAFREQITYSMEQVHGGYWHYLDSLFQESTKNVLRDGQVVEKSAYKEIHSFVRKYFKQGDRHTFREIIEMLSFGLLYRIYSCLRPCREKELIAKGLGISSVSIFTSCFYVLVRLRDDCAHPGVIWNKNFKPPKHILHYSQGYTWLKEVEKARTDKLYYRLCLLNYFLQIVDSEYNFTEDLLCLLDKYGQVISFPVMGFPVDWEKEKMWSKPDSL